MFNNKFVEALRSSLCSMFSEINSFSITGFSPSFMCKSERGIFASTFKRLSRTVISSLSLSNSLSIVVSSAIILDVETMDIGDTMHLSEITLPEGMTLDMDPALVVASVVAPSVAKVEVEEVEEEELLEGEEAPAEGEEAPKGEEKKESSESGKG